MFSKIRFCGRQVDETAPSEQAEGGHAKSDEAPDCAIGAAAESAGREPDVDAEHQGADAEATPRASSDIIASDENDQRGGCSCGDLTCGRADPEDGDDALEDSRATSDDKPSADTGQVDDRAGSDADDLSETGHVSPMSEDVPSVEGAPRCAASSLPFEAAGCEKAEGGNLRELGRRRRPRALSKPEPGPGKRKLTGQQRLLLLDTWRRSGLPAGDFAPLVGISKHTLYKWNKLFQEQGPAGLVDQPRRTRRGSQLPDLTRRTILMLKEMHPEWGCQRISDMLARGPALPASASAVARVLRASGYEMVDLPTRPHPDRVRRFERARPNQLWQTDLFSFVLKRQNRRLYLVAFMDDHSRFLVSFGLHASASTALVLEALEAGIASYGPPEEILTDNGPQYITWRGKSQFTKHLEKRGVRQIVAKPRRPQTLGKIERFWGTLWREFLEAAIFVDLADARTRIGLFVDYYNFQRVHRGVDGAVPADRFFGAATEVLRTLKERVAANALELARHGTPQRPFYVTGQVDGKPFSVHAEGQRLILRREDGQREEVTLSDAPTPASKERLPDPVCPQGAPSVPPGEPAQSAPPAPGQSRLDEPATTDREACELDAADRQEREPKGGAQ
jgi:transposase InsO family protein